MKKRNFLLGILFCAFSVSLFSQSHSITGRTVDDRGDVLEMTTVRLFSLTAKDTTFAKGVQTDVNGVFTLPNVSKGRYLLVFSAIGFDNFTKEIAVESQDVHVGTVRLREQVQHLGEVKVVGKAAELTVKGDTLEYNTAAYQMNENAVVEDLLKKMAGVEVDSEGNVTVNGETIQGIRVDGKKFFGDDVQTATKNIPADMIDKIQVIDNKSDIAKLTGFEDDETERIINLKLKENRKKGIFGNYIGGLGADMITNNDEWFDYGNRDFGNTQSDRAKHFFKEEFRYNANAFTNVLSGESQTTILGSANNTNEIRSGRGRGFFSGSNAGITWAENIGVNTNIDASKKINGLLIGGNAQVNHSYNNTESKQDKTTYSEEITYLNNDSTSKIAKALDAKINLEFDWTLDTANTILIKPNVAYTKNTSDGHNDYIYYRDSTIVINNGYQNQYTLSENISAEISALYSHKFDKKGRTLSFKTTFAFSNTKGNSETFSFNHLLNKPLIDQYTNSGNDAYSYSLQASWVEPLTKNCQHLLETTLLFKGNNRASNKDQYSKDTLTNEYRYDSVYSNALNNDFYSESLELNYRYVFEYGDLTAGMRLNPSQTHSKSYYGDILARDTTLAVFNWAPNVSFKYKFGKKEFARIIYNGNNTQPSITQIEPVRNNSNAMSETVGNLGLQPSFRHRLRFMYSKYNSERFSNIMTGARANITKDALVNNTIYDETGKVYTQTVNAKAVPWDVSADFMYNTPFAKKLLQIHTRTAVSFNRRVAYVLREQKASDIEEMIDQNAFILGSASFTNNFQANENISLRFTHELLDLGIRGNFTYSLTNNSLSKTHRQVYNWSATADVQFHLPKNWNINADCGYSDKIGYGSDLGETSEILLNASVEKTWQNATLSIKAFDLLHQKKNIVQIVGADYITYAKYNTLPTYALLSFTYKINKMGKNKATGRAAFMQEMIESGGKPPTGPPPHMR